MSVHETGNEEAQSPNRSLSESDIPARLAVWTPLAQLFRDNVLHGADYDRIAAELKAAGETAETARHVLVHEVAPVFYDALTVKNGDGTGWPPEAVETMMRDFLALSESRRKWLRTQAGRMSRRVMLGGWEQVEQRMLADQS